MSIPFHIDVRGRLAIGKLLRWLVGLRASSTSHSIGGLPVVATLPLQLEQSITLENIALVVRFTGLFKEVVA